MSVLLHLSDLHLGSERAEQSEILDALASAVASERRQRGRDVDLVVISGDVFESASLEIPRATRAFSQLHASLIDALGRPTPFVVVPGNHDRRIAGLLGPHRSELWSAFAASAPRDVFVHGVSLQGALSGESPFLAQVVPHRWHRLPLWLVAYDSTFLPRGLLGAGGTMRREDLLHVASQIGAHRPEWPIVVLLHHHLVPTPVTDVDPIDADERSSFVRWGVTELLPRLLAHADREEWMMTALGAGSALSALHDLGRAVLVLHGHKHNATARSLDATVAGQGDVLIASAGSAGTAGSVRQAVTHRSARVWPSFNVVELDPESVAIDTAAFGWKGRSRGEVEVTPLVCASRRGSQWRVVPTPRGARDRGPRLAEDTMRVRLLASRKPGRYDLAIERRLTPDLDARVPHYVETLAPLPEAAVFVRGVQVDVPHDLPLDFEPHALDQTRYLVEAGAYRTHAEALRTQRGSAAPYGHVELLVRYRCARAELRVTGLPFVEAFASATDAGSGQQSVVPIVREDDALVVRVLECPARTLLRLHWPLEDVASSAPRLELPVVPRVRARRGSVARAERPGLEAPDDAWDSHHHHAERERLDERSDARRLPADDGSGSARSAGSAADKTARRAEPLRADRR
ncbi:MAG: metallophosphoesterase [Myxococcota bacterium]|nr:metallophosphoesterase [Myxococcota bacterium]